MRWKCLSDVALAWRSPTTRVKAESRLAYKTSGWGAIRTRDGLSPMPVFKTLCCPQPVPSPSNHTRITASARPAIVPRASELAGLRGAGRGARGRAGRVRGLCCHFDFRRRTARIANVVDRAAGKTIGCIASNIDAPAIGIRLPDFGVREPTRTVVALRVFHPNAAQFLATYFDHPPTPFAGPCRVTLSPLS